MAEKRMFTKKITESDAFLDMPVSAQALYFHLNMAADDDGFVNSPRKIQRIVGASDDDLKLLLAKNFLIGFESGVVAVKHWKMHNYIPKDRYTPTVYIDEYKTLAIKDNNAYTLSSQSLLPQAVEAPYTDCIQTVYNSYTDCIQDVDNSYTDCIHRLDKNRVDKISIDKNREEKKDAFVEFAGDNDELLSALKGFEDMRKHIKSALTDNTKKLLVKKLERDFKPDEWVAVIEQSTFRGWKDIYPIKGKGDKAPESGSPNWVGGMPKIEKDWDAIMARAKERAQYIGKKEMM